MAEKLEKNIRKKTWKREAGKQKKFTNKQLPVNLIEA